MRARMKPISDQVVVLFGATSGIGLDTAFLMAEKGANLVIAGRSQEGLDQAVERVREHARLHHTSRRGTGGMSLEDIVIGVAADVTNWEQVKNVADQAVATFGRIDTWVHLAAVSEWALFEDTSPDEFRQVIDVNLVGAAYGAMAALPYMRQQDGGSIILISSVAGRVPIPYQAAYNASKHGVLGMAETLRMEMRHERIPVNVTTILPSSINTPLFSKARTKLDVEPAPIPPVYDPRLVSKAILYASEHPVREIVVGGMGYSLQSINRVSRPLAKAFVRMTGFPMQRSDEPKSPQAPDNLYHHIEGHNQVLGEYPGRRFSVYTWFATHPGARLLLAGALLGGAAFLGYRTIQARRKLTIWQRMGKQVKEIRKSIPEVRAPSLSMPKVSLPDVSMPHVSMPHVSMPQFRREPTLRERVIEGVGDRYQTVREGVGQRYQTVREGVGHGYETVRDHIPGRRPLSWWESLPLLGLLPFLHKESRIERARKQIRQTAGSAADRFTDATGQLNKTVRNLPIRETVKDLARNKRFLPARKSTGEKEVYFDKRTELLPDGEKEVTYRKVEEKLPTGVKETVFERVEEKRRRR